MWNVAIEKVNQGLQLDKDRSFYCAEEGDAMMRTQIHFAMVMGIQHVGVKDIFDHKDPKAYRRFQRLIHGNNYLKDYSGADYNQIDYFKEDIDSICTLMQQSQQATRDENDPNQYNQYRVLNSFTLSQDFIPPPPGYFIGSHPQLQHAPQQGTFPRQSRIPKTPFYLYDHPNVIKASRTVENVPSVTSQTRHVFPDDRQFSSDDASNHDIELSLMTLTLDVVSKAIE